MFRSNDRQLKSTSWRSSFPAATGPSEPLPHLKRDEPHAAAESLAANLPEAHLYNQPDAAEDARTSSTPDSSSNA